LNLYPCVQKVSCNYNNLETYFGPIWHFSISNWCYYVSFLFVTTFKPIYQFTLHFKSNWNLLNSLGSWQHDILNQIRLQWAFWGVTMWQFQMFWWLIHICSWSCVEMVGSNKLLKEFIRKCEIEKKEVALKMKNQKQGKNNIYTKNIYIKWLNFCIWTPW